MTYDEQMATNIRKNMARTGLAIALVGVFLNFYDGEKTGIIAAVVGMALGYFADLFLAMDYEDEFTGDERTFRDIGAGLAFFSIIAVAISLVIWVIG